MWSVLVSKKCRRFFLAILAVNLVSLLPVFADAALELCSPKDGDSFQVAKPLLFWQSNAASKRYEVFVDGKEIGKIPAAQIPVMSFTPTRPMAVGPHQWQVKATLENGSVLESTNFTFTIASSTNFWPPWAIGPFVRYGQNPILTPQGTNWEAWNVYNPGVIYDQNRFRMLYRAEDKNDISREGYAESLDGVSFSRRPFPVIDATEKFEQKYGCEDARLLKYQDTYYAFYTGNDSNKIALCEAVSTNGIDWQKLGITQSGPKNGAVVCDPSGTPIKINGKFCMYIGNNKMGICYSDDLRNWSQITKIDVKFPEGWVNRPWEPCVAVANYSKQHPDNIVLFIAGTLNGKGRWFYAISEMLFCKTNLTAKVAQLDDCIMKPREAYESGTFTNCLWMNSIILHNGQWWMHYGAGDRNIGLATAPLE